MRDIRLGFAVANLEEALTLARALRVKVLGEIRSEASGRSAVMEDPDGRSVELYEREATS